MFGPAIARNDAVLQPADPGNGAAVVEAYHELASHFDAAFDPDDNSYHVGCFAFRRHEIDQADAPLGGREGRLEDQRAFRYRLSVTPAGTCGAICHRPFFGSPSSAAKQLSESNRGRQSQSIDPFRPTRAAVSQSPIIP